MPDVEDMPKAAPAASEKVKEAVKSAASGAAEVVKTIIVDSDDEHDEL